MNLRRKILLSVLPGVLALAAGCAAVVPSVGPAVDPLIVKTLAPTGSLRVGVYLGSPTSLVRDAKTGDKAGVAFELGHAFGRQLGVPVEIKEFTRLADVLEALKGGAVDFTFTNATEVRARDMDFTGPLVRLELGYLVPPTSALKDVADVDKPGVRVGVAQGSSSQGALGRLFKSATVVPAPSVVQAQTMLREGQLDAFATNKGILNEMADALPDYRILDGRWGLETMAIAIPQQRGAGLPYVQQFAEDARRSGLLAGIVKRAGLRGTSSD
jgi:polar amino acid transport system substrate-binding protein